MPADRSARIALRKEIYKVLQDAVNKGIKGDIDYVCSVVNNLNNTLNYSVNANPRRSVTIDGLSYHPDQDFFIIVNEGNSPVFTIYQDQRDLRVRVHCPEYHLMTDAELIQKRAELRKRDFENGSFVRKTPSFVHRPETH